LKIIDIDKKILKIVDNDIDKEITIIVIDKKILEDFRNNRFP